MPNCFSMSSSLKLPSSRYWRSPAGSKLGFSSSNSSWISPRSSSIAFSRVTRPAVPPCSSTTIAMCVFRRRISRKRSSARLNSGTRKAGSQYLPTWKLFSSVVGQVEEVLGVQDPDHVVEASPVDRQARKLVLPQDQLDVLEARRFGNRHDLRARHHDVPDGLVAEFDDAGGGARFSSRWMTPSSAPRLKTLLSSSSVRPGRCLRDAEEPQHPVRELHAELGERRAGS